MNPRMIDLYNEELQHLRGEAREFAAEYPSAAAMLALDTGRAEDPYVERLLEGVAYLAARVRLKLDSQYPVFTQQLIDVLFPGWLAPTPSACVLRMNVDPGDSKLADGPVMPRGTCVVGTLRGASGLRCEFETTRDVQLLPLQLTAVRYNGTRPEVKSADPAGRRAAASLTLELDLLAELAFSQLDVDRLSFYVACDEPHASQLMELVAGRCVAVGLSADVAGRRSAAWLPGNRVRHLGFDANEAMLPIPVRGHAGFRVLREYAALPQKFRFFEICGLRPALAGVGGRKLFIHLQLGANHPKLESVVRADSLALFCTPAINLRERSLDRCDIEPGQVDYQVIADRSQVRRQEVVQLTDVVGGGDGFERRFAPIFEVAASGRLATGSFYTVRRERRMMTQRELQARRSWLQGAEGQGRADAEDDRQGHTGSEMFISLAERGAGPQGRGLKYLSMRALCMDREVPRYLRNQPDKARYDAVESQPVKHIDCLAPPSEPLDYAVDGYEPWSTLSHLFVNYLSLVDSGPTDGADALRAMLCLYAPTRAHLLARQAEGLLGVKAELVTRRVPNAGPLAFARGLHVTLRAGEHGFDGGSPFMLGAMLEHFLASHVAINSFVETSLVSEAWPEALTWPMRIGRRPSA
jgi:type VI secretion system protein ImpG